MLFNLALASILGLGTQQINCFPKDDKTSDDRAVLSFKLPASSQDLPSEGTLFLSSGIGDNGETENSGVLKLAHVPESDDDASKGLVRYEARNSTSVFTVTLSEKDIGKTLKDMDITIDLERNDHYRSTQEVTCYATVFADAQP